MGGWSTPRPGRFTPGKDPVPTVHEAGRASEPLDISTMKGTVYFRMAENELVCLRISVICDISTNECKKKLKKTAFVDTEIRGIQTPRRNECAYLSQNNYGLPGLGYGTGQPCSSPARLPMRGVMILME